MIERDASRAERVSWLTPIPLAPVHRPVWRRWFRRRCSCGLCWKTCPDRHLPVPVEPVAAPIRREIESPRWNQPTEIHWVGAADLITRGQAHRANGGPHA